MSRNRSWCFTCNNYTQEDLVAIESLKYSYLVVGREVGESGTPHLQGFIQLQEAKTLSALRKLLGSRFHLEIRRGTFQQAIDYCKKDGQFVEDGIAPKDQKQKGSDERERWDGILESAKRGEFENIPSKVFIQHYSTFKRIKVDYAAPAEQNNELLHEWICGPPGTGKSWAAREENPNYFLKSVNKWWCGYDGEENVIMDEVELDSGPHIGHNLKIWADIYPFRAEVKHGSTAIIRPRKFIVTSNYEIEQVFQHDQQLVLAIKRRFKVRRFMVKYVK